MRDWFLYVEASNKKKEIVNTGYTNVTAKAHFSSYCLAIQSLLAEISSLIKIKV